MRIDGTDASNVSFTPPQRVDSSTKDIPTTTKDKLTDGMNLTQLAELDKRGGLPIQDKVVIDAIERANKAISVSNRQFEYSIHEKTKQIMIKVIDSDTHEVVREIPPEKVLDMVAKMWEMSGILVDERR
jgi:flagellar protein FlaG